MGISCCLVSETRSDQRRHHIGVGAAIGSSSNGMEDYFRRMLDSVEGFYYRQAARLYLMRFDHPGILSTMTVSYFDEEDPGSALRAPMAPWSLDEIRERCTRTRVRGMARCTDLLEVSPISKDGELVDS